jgi:protein required for attachment to host cells
LILVTLAGRPGRHGGLEEDLAMQDSGTTWIVAADGSRARIFEERTRGGEVRERAELAMEIAGGDWPRATPHPASVHQRVGSGRHADNQHKPSAEAERRFLARLAEALEKASQTDAFDRLVIAAPPTALGELRAQLAPAVLARLEASEPHNRTHEDAPEMRRHLRQIRAEA